MTKLVKITEASKKLGFSQSTLRRFIEKQGIEVFITPGGHRRFNLAEMRKLISKYHASRHK